MLVVDPGKILLTHKHAKTNNLILQQLLGMGGGSSAAFQWYCLLLCQPT